MIIVLAGILGMITVLVFAWYFEQLYENTKCPKCGADLIWHPTNPRFDYCEKQCSSKGVK